jgi:hypothetical protein
MHAKNPVQYNAIFVNTQRELHRSPAVLFLFGFWYRNEIIQLLGILMRIDNLICSKKLPLQILHPACDTDAPASTPDSRVATHLSIIYIGYMAVFAALELSQIMVHRSSYCRRKNMLLI